MKIRKAIIPAAGLGTRFLPATKAMPKEMLPIVDKPVIQYIVEEAVESGIEDIIIVTGKGKRAIEDHFDRAWELEESLKQKGKLEELNEVIKSSQLANIHYIRQKEPKGLGHAIWSARTFIGNEPFAVLLGDNVILAKKPGLQQMMEKYQIYGKSVVGVQSVETKEISRYGIVDGLKIEERLYQVKGLVEKPKIEDAPSNLAILGRYILTPNIFKQLENAKPSVGNEIQLTDAIMNLTKEEEVFAYQFAGICFDVGEKMSFLKTNLEFALQRDDLKVELLRYIQDLNK